MFSFFLSIRDAKHLAFASAVPSALHVLLIGTDLAHLLTFFKTLNSTVAFFVDSYLNKM